MRGPGTSKHCVTNVVAAEEAAIAAVIAAIFLGTMKLEAMFHCVQKCNLIFFSGRDVFESAALISQSAILDFHSQHSVHSAPGSRMDGIAFCPFRNRNAE